MLHRSAVIVLSLAAASLPVVAVAQDEADEAVVEILRRHGLEESQVMDHLSWLCDVYGPRLTNSPNHWKASEWAVSRLTEFGLKNARIEKWGPFGSGWRLDGFGVEVVGENPWVVHAYPKAWSPSIDGTVVAEVVDASALSQDELRAMDLTGKIVMIEPRRAVSEPFDQTAKRWEVEDLWEMATGARMPREEVAASAASAAPRRDIRRGPQVFDIVYAKKPLAIVDRYFKGDYGTVFATGVRIPRPEGASRRDGPRGWDPKGAHVVPQFTLAVEHYNRISRLLERGQRVEMSLELRSTFFEEERMPPNVLAEIPGTDPELGSEVVMLGAHLDSWHTGTGATDNGCGSAVMIEAMRLLTKLVEERGEGPRRTVMIGLWGGEEQGLLGSRAFVEKHVAERGGRGEAPMQTFPLHAKLSGYYNLDNGTGRIRGVHLQGNDAVRPIFREWLKPFHDLGAGTLTLRNTGGTDHLAFDAVGIPGFQFIQDPVAYSTRTHHSNMDNWDHAVADDLQQAATIIASFAWHTAQRDTQLPRK